MIASVWKIDVSVGDIVESGSVLVVLEAMKMEIVIRVPMSVDYFKVEAVFKKSGDRVQAGDGLVLLLPLVTDNK